MQYDIFMILYDIKIMLYYDVKVFLNINPPQ